MTGHSPFFLVRKVRSAGINHNQPVISTDLERIIMLLLLNVSLVLNILELELDRREAYRH